MNQQSDDRALTPPPEGVISGDSIPRENELDDREEQKVQEFIGVAKSKGEPWVSMTDEELREKAIETLAEHGVIR